MNMVSTISVGGCDALIDALRAEFGGVLTDRILQDEALDFLWNARRDERYLGQFEGDNFWDEEPSRELSLVLILSVLEDRWHVAACLVDGEGAAVELLWKRRFDSRALADLAFRKG